MPDLGNGCVTALREPTALSTSRSACPLSLLTPFTGTDNHSAAVVICLAGPGRRLRRPHRPARLPAAGNVAVLPAAQNRGFGARLLGLAEDHARSLGLSEIRLYTNKAMTETPPTRHGYVETHQAEQHGFHQVLFRKLIDSPSDSRLFMVSVGTSIVPPGPCPPPADTPGPSTAVTTPQVTTSVHDFAGSVGRSIRRQLRSQHVGPHDQPRPPSWPSFPGRLLPSWRRLRSLV